MTTRIDMDDELTYSRTEHQLRQLALSRAHNLLEYEVIWVHIDILAVAIRRLSRRWKVKTLLAGLSPTSPNSPISNRRRHDISVDFSVQLAFLRK